MPSYKAIRTGRLYEQIVEQIEQQVLTGELQIGDRLSSERELAEQFQVSRTAVREAVKTLHEKGLVEVHPGRGTFITNSTSQAVRHSLGLMMKIDRVEGSINLVEVREILEPEIAYLAAIRAKKEHIAAMREAVIAMDMSLDNADVFIASDLDFHLALAQATQNALILTLVDSIVDLLQGQRTNIFRVEGGAERGQYHHKRILDAVVRRDSDAARDAMRAHLQQVREDSKASSAEQDKVHDIGDAHG